MLNDRCRTTLIATYLLLQCIFVLCTTWWIHFHERIREDFALGIVFVILRTYKKGFG